MKDTITLEELESLKRYDCELTGSNYMYNAEMIEVPKLHNYPEYGGDWVRYEDVKALFTQEER